MFFGGGFPFGDFESMGGGGRPKADVDTTKFYTSLGVSKDSSVSEIKKAYRKLAIQHHPDKGGDPEKFKEISRAYEVLSDPEKRKMYDEHGEEGLDGSGGTDAGDIFDLFFGGRRRGGAPEKKKGEDIVSSLKVTLEQLYKGATRKLAVNKDVLCATCDGLGGPKDAIETCGACNGKGIRIQIRQIGPMIQQTQAKCPACNAEGSIIPEFKKCRTCMGEKTVKERKILEIYIEPGAPNGYKSVFRGEADERPGEIPGDVVFTFEVQGHALFKRKNTDLFLEKEITLYEALTGFKFYLQHLDDRKLIIQNHPGEVTKPNDLLCVVGEGMPTHKNPFVKGNLFIHFTVAFPTADSLDDKTRAALRKLLPLPARLGVAEDAHDVEHHYVQHISPEDRRRASNRGEAYDDDDDDANMGGGGQRVQCRQQ